MKSLLALIVLLSVPAKILAETEIPDFGYIMPEDSGPNYVVVDRIGEHVFDYFEPVGEVVLQVVESSDGVRQFNQRTSPEYFELDLQEGSVFVVPSPPQALLGDRVVCEISLPHSPWFVSLNSEAGYVALVDRRRDGDNTYVYVVVHDLTGQMLFVRDLNFIFESEPLPQAPDGAPAIFGLLLEWQQDSLLIATEVEDDSFGFQGKIAVREIHTSDWSAHEVSWTETVRQVMSSEASDATKLRFLETWCGSSDYDRSEFWRIVPLDNPVFEELHHRAEMNGIDE